MPEPVSPAAAETSDLVIRGARTHNLKNIDLTLPVGKLVIVTGVSGSGKSSLAFDTIYAEGQRRYVESLSAYARQFLERMEKPDVDRIDGISPAIAIRQKNSVRNPRSTVGTTTEIHDYMRLLFARIGRTYCRNCGREVVRETAEVVARELGRLPEGARLLLGFDLPIVSVDEVEWPEVDELAEAGDEDGVAAAQSDTAAREGVSSPNGSAGSGSRSDPHRAAAVSATIESLRRKGFGRLLVDGRAVSFDELDAAALTDRSTLQVIVDRVRIGGEDLQQRLTDSIETAYLEGGGAAWAVRLTDSPVPSEVFQFSERFECRPCGITYEDPQPRLFSFNNPFGACPECGGLGLEQHIDADLVIPDRDASLRKGAIAPWAKSSSPYYLQTLTALAKHYRFTLDAKWKDLPKKVQDAILYGSGEEEIKFTYDDGLRGYTTKKPFEGVITNLERRFKETESEWAREDLAKYFTDVPCAACQGARLKPEALCVKIADANIAQVAELSVRKAGDWFAALPEKLTPKQNEIASRVLKEIRERLRFLVDVGLDYLTLSRGSGTLSGGESQRIRLASQIGSGLTGVLYVLDEPSIGLHQRDNNRLLETLRRLRDLGNTVVVVEHDEDAILTADHVIDMGPGAGIHGGAVVAEGTPEKIMQNPASLTGQYLSGFRQIPLPSQRRKGRKGRVLQLVG
ncbi:MAG: hypothetical protein ACM3JC_13680, partial [Rudaea sp.]